MEFIEHFSNCPVGSKPRRYAINCVEDLYLTNLYKESVTKWKELKWDGPYLIGKSNGDSWWVVGRIVN